MNKGLTFSTRIGEITVYDGEYVSINNVGRLFGLQGETFISKIGKKYLVVFERGIYSTPSGNSSVQKMITLETLEWVIVDYFDFDRSVARDIISLLKGDVAPTEVSAPVPVQGEEPNVSSISTLLSSFLKEADLRIGQNAIWAYQQSDHFRQDKKRVLEEWIEQVKPQVIERLEKKLRVELAEEMIPKIREEVTRESEALKRALRSEQTRQIFVPIRKVQSDEDDEEFLNEILSESNARSAI